MKNFIVSIDGPAGSGKEKISKYISKKYKFYHLDSGIMYRKLAYEIIKNKIDYQQTITLKQFLNKIDNLSPHNHKNLRKDPSWKDYTIFPMTRKDIQLVFSGIFVILEIHDNQ